MCIGIMIAVFVFVFCCETTVMFNISCFIF